MGKKTRSQHLEHDQPLPPGEVQRGIVKLILPDKGFGFIQAPDGLEFFFHRSAAPDFASIAEGTAVQFVPGSGPKGPRAESVQLA